MTDAAGFGAELRRLRQAAGLSTTALAARVGVSQAFITTLERDRRQANAAMAVRLSAALGLGAAAALQQRAAEARFLARSACCPRCGFGGDQAASPCRSSG